MTVPSCAYLLQSSPKEDHGHGHGNEGHGEHGEHKEHEEQSESEGDGEKSTEKGGDDDANAESKDSEGKEKSSDDTGSDEGHDKSEDSDSDEDKKQDTPDTSDDESSKNEVHEAEGGGDVEGVQFKGPTKGGPEGDTRKHVPDAKGGNKKRIESDYGKRQGTSDDQPQRDSGGSQKDKVSHLPIPTNAIPSS